MRAVTVNFDQGLPDPAHFPVDVLRACVVETLEEDGAAALTYYGRGGPAEMQYGYLGLREQLAAWMTRRDGRAVDPEGVVLANGSTDGLALAINAHLGPGDGAIVEAATYPLHAAVHRGNRRGAENGAARRGRHGGRRAPGRSRRAQRRGGTPEADRHHPVVPLADRNTAAARSS